MSFSPEITPHILTRHMKNRNVRFLLCLHEGEHFRDRQDNCTVGIEDFSCSGSQGQGPRISCTDEYPVGLFFFQEIQFVFREGGMTVFPFQAF